MSAGPDTVLSRRDRIWRRAGAVLQGLILGSLAMVAILNLLRVASDAQIFRYQGF
jgi:hypothetical protein